MVKGHEKQVQLSDRIVALGQKYVLHLMVSLAATGMLALCSMVYSCSHPFITTIADGQITVQRVGVHEVLTTQLQNDARAARRQHSLELGAELISSPRFAAAYEQTLKNKLSSEYDSSEKAATRQLMDQFRELTGRDHQTWIPAPDPVQPSIASNKGE